MPERADEPPATNSAVIPAKERVKKFNDSSRVCGRNDF